ncbi:MAG: ATP phosphoribosyltransferase, partial [Okeania sp. SIO2D1]|nr:ATP phosphoribosyltransferase [Okeania sp. SIO2D1]
SQMESKKYVSITANVHGKSADEIGDLLMNKSGLSGITGLQGPTIAKVYSGGKNDWYAVTIVVKQEMLLSAINHLRKVGGTDITVSSPNYIFGSKSQTYEAFLEKLN